MRGSTHVQVYNLRNQSCYHKNKENVEEPLVELRRATNLCDNGRAQALRRYNGEAADETADGQIHQHALLAISGPNPKRHEGAPEDDDARVRQEARRDNITLHLLDVGDTRLLGSIQDDDDGPDDADEAADLADKGEPFLEEDGGQDGRDDDGECA